MRNAFKSILLAFTMMIAGTVAYAQVTTATLTGRVVDQDGIPVPGAAVQATHEPSGTHYGVITNNEGRYTIQGMRTGGPYKVEISNLGYQSVAYTDISLKLGQAFVLDALLNESSEFLDALVFVASPTSKFAAQEKTGAVTNISNDDILALPTANRSITDIVKLSPYGGNGMNVAGGDGRSVNFTIDGANFNNNFGLSSYLPGGGMPVSMDAIEEVQIVVSPFDVRQSNFIGGGVNAITKSGTNTPKVTAYAYHQSGKLSGNKIDGESVVVGRDPQTVFGGTVGFPIVKNKLFFFASAEYSGSKKQVSQWQPSTDGVKNKDAYIAQTTVADMERVSNHLRDVYGYDTGGWDLSGYNKPTSNLKVLAKLDWNITDNHHLAFRFNYTSNQDWVGTNGNSADFSSTKDGSLEELKGTRLSLNRLSEYSMAYVNSIYSMRNDVRSYSLDLNSRFTQNLSNQLLITYSNIEDIRGSDSKPFPFIDILNGYEANPDGSVKKQTLEPYISAGYELFTWYNGVHNRVFNAKDDLTYYAGNHKITGGVNFEYQFADNAYLREGTGYYRFRSVDDFINGAAPETVALTYGYKNNGMGDTPSARIQYSQIGLYGQDEWDVTDRFKLTAGIRFDTILYNDKDLMTNNAVLGLDYNGRHIDTGHWPKTNVQISPRVGFTWDVFGNRSLKVRGGTGLFAGRLPLVYMTNMPTNAAMFQHLSVLTTHYENGVPTERNAGLDQFAAVNNGGRMPVTVDEILNKLNSIDADKNPINIDPSMGSISSPINAVDPNFKMPQVWKTSIGIDYQVPVSFPLSLTAEYTFKKTINGTLIADWNVTDNANWPQWTGPDNRHVYNSAYSGYTGVPAYVLTNTNKGYGHIFVLSATAEPVRDLKITASYTFNDQKEITGMPGNNAGSVYQSLPTVDGPSFGALHGSTYVNPHRVMASISYRMPWGTNIGLFYQGYVPTGYSYMFDGDVNGDGISQDLIYIPNSKNEILFVSDEARDNFWAFVEQDSYLSSHKGKYAEAYGVHAPMVHYVDLKLSQDIKFRLGSTKHTIQLSADLMNAGNLLNNSWSVINTFDKSANNGQILSLSGYTPDGQPIFDTPLKAGAKTWSHSHSSGQLWYLQLGVKYLFN
ncbi:MAG: TonB-dependent receptor [Bacteroidales bacterium]|nr:TonB-dependent receptor [Bacteroidales bacterium]